VLKYVGETAMSGLPMFSAGSYLVKVAVNVQFEKVRWIVGGSSCIVGQRVFEAESFQVEAVDEGVDEPDWVLLIHVFFERVGEEGCLVSVEAFYVFAQ